MRASRSPQRLRSCSTSSRTARSVGCSAPPLQPPAIAKAVNATVISLDEAPQGYKDFDSGVAKKFVLDPHGLIKS